MPKTGHKHNEETKKKIGDAHRGRVHSEKSRKNMSDAHKGQHSSVQTQFPKGNIPWNKGGGGYKLSISIETRAEMGKERRGRKVSESTRIKLRESNSGDKNHFWKGGVTKLNERIRKNSKMKLWREAVFTRDNWTCVFCLKRGEQLHADHIKRYSDILYRNKITSIEEAILCEELWDISNGRTLCVSCHKTTDTYGNKGNSVNKDRSKSGDELDALTRHLMEAGTIDTDGIRHSTKIAWRSLANLEKELENEILLNH